jgi:hypothetical protein
MIPALALGTLLALAPAASAKGAPSCVKAGSKTVKQNKSVRVYRVTRGESTTLYACRRSNSTHVRLARAFDDGFTTSATYANVRLTGWFVAWSATATDISCKADCPPGYEPTTRSLGVYDVRRRQSRSVAGAPVPGALVLSKDGAVAWIAAGTGEGQYEVRASVRANEDELLDSGTIDPAGLRIEITIISWFKDGAEKFARLS